MDDSYQDWARISLARLLPRIKEALNDWCADEPARELFLSRLERHFPRLFRLLLTLYGTHYDFYYHLEQTLFMAARMWSARPAGLKALDQVREADPAWFHSNRMMGGVCYVDLFAGNLDGVRGKIPYFKELGLTYLHLMPLFLSPEGNNDGGYAVSSYRQVDPALGTMQDLEALAQELRRNGISLVLDFVFNHTSDEHVWAHRALAGSEEYRAYYLTFPDRTMPDAYGQHLRDIFPDERPGSFTYIPEMERWVWTTFHSFQWDLNYSNPAVFTSMGEEMLFLANRGAEILRLDALAFVWKRLGTSCENLPEAHLLIQAFNALARIAAPSLLFKSEAIVHPDDVAKYISEEECQISYNPLLMALLWEALATGDARLLAISMHHRFQIGECCAWANYVRSHDDIGWTFDDEDAARLGINGYDHRRFLNAFYAGRIDWSFAAGLPFQENPRTGDMRISGTCASLAGLEKALSEGEVAIELAIRRVLLLYGIVLSIGGIPLLYLGDEIGTLNDYSYTSDPSKAHDSRWIHRPFTDWERVARRNDPLTIEGRTYKGLMRLVELRKACAAFGSDAGTAIIETGNRHVFGYMRHLGGESVLVLANFNRSEQRVQVAALTNGSTRRDLVSGSKWSGGDLLLEPYEFIWLAAE